MSVGSRYCKGPALQKVMLGFAGQGPPLYTQDRVFMCVCTYLFNRHFLSAYYVPQSPLSTRNPPKGKGAPCPVSYLNVGCSHWKLRLQGWKLTLGCVASDSVLSRPFEDCFPSPTLALPAPGGSFDRHTGVWAER